MDEILKRLEALEKRLSVIESRLIAGVPQTPVAQMGSQTAPPPPPYVAEMFGGRSPQPAQPGMTAGVMPPPPVPAAGGSVESYIGRKVLGVIGALAVLAGGAYFLKYAFDSGWIGVNGRIALGVVGGLAFIAVGEWLRKKFPRFADVLSGLGGLGLLYLSVYAAFSFYGLITQFTAFGFMSAVTAFGVVLALFANSVQLAAAAVIGGFLTPFLLSTGVPNDFNFFAYLAILGVGILAVSFFKKWQQLTLIGFVATIINFVSWYGVYYNPDKLFFTIYVLCIFYAIYLFASVLANLVAKVPSNSGDLFLFTINPAWFFGWIYFLLMPKYEDYLGFIAAGLGALYVVLAYIASVTASEDKKLPLFLGAVAVIFLTIAVPLQLEQNAITIAWAAEAAVLFIVGTYLRNYGMRIAAMFVLGIAVIRLFAYDSGAGDLAYFAAVFNRRFFTYFMTIAASAVMGYFAMRSSPEEVKGEKVTQGLLWSAVNFLVIVAITLEIIAFFDARIFKLEQAKFEELSRRSPVAQEFYPGELESRNRSEASYQVRSLPEYKSLSNQRNAAISIFWTLWAVLLITLGMVYRSALLRWSALVLFGVTIIKVFLFDLSVLKTIYRVVSFMVLGVILLAASFLYYRYQKNLDSNPQQ